MTFLLINKKRKKKKKKIDKMTTVSQFQPTMTKNDLYIFTHVYIIKRSDF